MAMDYMTLKIEYAKLKAENELYKQLYEKRGVAKKDINDVELVERFLAGESPYSIGKSVGRSQNCMINRLKRLGLWVPKQRGNQYKNKKG